MTNSTKTHRYKVLICWHSSQHWFALRDIQSKSHGTKVGSLALLMPCKASPVLMSVSTQVSLVTASHCMILTYCSQMMNSKLTLTVPCAKLCWILSLSEFRCSRTTCVRSSLCYLLLYSIYFCSNTLVCTISASVYAHWARLLCVLIQGNHKPTAALPIGPKRLLESRWIYLKGNCWHEPIAALPNGPHRLL